MIFKNVLNTLLVGLCLVLLAAPLEAQRIIPSPQATSSGLVPFDLVSTGSSATPVNITTAAGQLYGLSIDAGANTAGTAVYVNFYNAASANVTPGTTAALFSFLVVAGSATAPPVVRDVIPWGTGIGIPFGTALSFNCTTTRATTGGGGATGTTSACHVNGVRR